MQVLGAGIVRYQPALQKEVFHQHGARIARHHRPSPWPGRSLLIMSNENEDDPLWWDRLLVGEHDTHAFDCDHLALLRRPYVDRVAELMIAAA
jgi:hypothetical protein